MGKRQVTKRHPSTNAGRHGSDRCHSVIGKDSLLGNTRVPATTRSCGSSNHHGSQGCHDTTDRSLQHMRYIHIILALFQSMFFGPGKRHLGNRRSTSPNDGLTNFIRVLTSLILGTGEPRLRPVRQRRTEHTNTRHQHRRSNSGFWPPDRS